MVVSGAIIARILWFAGFVCEFLAAITAAGAGLNVGPALAWAFGGLACWLLGMAIG